MCKVGDRSVDLEGLLLPSASKDLLSGPPKTPFLKILFFSSNFFNKM